MPWWQGRWEVSVREKWNWRPSPGEGSRDLQEAVVGRGHGRYRAGRIDEGLVFHLKEVWGVGNGGGQRVRVSFSSFWLGRPGRLWCRSLR